MTTRAALEDPIGDRLVSFLASRPRGATGRELAHYLGISQPTLSRLLRNLRSRGLVVSEGSARSTRYHWVGGRGRLASLRRRRMHEWIAAELIDRPELLDEARVRLQRIHAANPQGSIYHQRWEELLSGPLHELLRSMTEDGEQADVLRKESPLTFVMTPEQRLALYSQFRQSHEPLSA